MAFFLRQKQFLWICAGIVLFGLISCSKELKKTSLPDKYPIIPTPQKVVYGGNEIFFSTASVLKGDFPNEALLLRIFLKERGIVAGEKGIHIKFAKDATRKNGESYELLIEDKMITLTSASAKGAFYGVQTLKQLFRNKNGMGAFPEIDVADWPAFKVRGFMHDVGRNFQSVALLKEQIEVMAQYKMNVFHWHLTDNPGWRLESKIYPELQSDKTSSRNTGKFYSQEDFKDILSFCKERKITVIPEFDIPGHTAAFRRAFNVESMKEEQVLPILLDLFDELCQLAGPEEMPYIHIGTDEVRNKEEYVDHNFVLAIIKHIKKRGREVIVWKEGITVEEDSTSIHQLWAQFEPRKGHRFIDSRANYINHLDPFAGMARLFFQQPCRQARGDDLALGGTLCAWPDNRIENERDILRQNPIYPSIVFYSDAIWKGRDKNYPAYWAKLPPRGTPELATFKNFEEKVLTHKDLFFKGKEFPYIKQTEIRWKIIGPFDHENDLSNSFPVEDQLKESYLIDGQEYKWKDSIVGGTIHLKHFFGFPSYTDKDKGTYYAYAEIYSPNQRIQDFWIGFQGWSRSGGRRGGPFPDKGQWHTTNPKIWVNDTEISPPIWKQPNLGIATDEIPFVDEDYFYRTPTKVTLNEGWNKIFLKIPHGGTSWKWMFTCIPVHVDNDGVSEVKEIKFSTSSIWH